MLAYGKANIAIDATGDITIWKAKLKAEVTDSGKATIWLNAGENVRIEESSYGGAKLTVLPKSL